MQSRAISERLYVSTNGLFLKAIDFSYMLLHCHLLRGANSLHFSKPANEESKQCVNV